MVTFWRGGCTIQVQKGKSLSGIAAIIGCSIATVSRELKRDNKKGKYRPSETQARYKKLQEKCRRPLLMAKGQLRKVVSRLLVEEQWSPEQISHRLAKEGKATTISYNTIYRAIKAGAIEAKGTRTNSLRSHLQAAGRVVWYGLAGLLLCLAVGVGAFWAHWPKTTF
ncbi:MAG: hypothetical protein HFF16_09470 [Angelakisella sp.]|nr:hypothetical protein [Angelakisella sp.]MCI9529911.1 hypothetical protein [Angelakisella sp.]